MSNLEQVLKNLLSFHVLYFAHILHSILGTFLVLLVREFSEPRGLVIFTMHFPISTVETSPTDFFASKLSFCFLDIVHPLLDVKHY